MYLKGLKTVIITADRIPRVMKQKHVFIIGVKRNFYDDNEHENILDTRNK